MQGNSEEDQYSICYDGSAVCQPQASLGIATAKVMLRCVHQGLGIGASHMHCHVVVLGCSISLNKNAFLGKFDLVFAFNF